MRKYVFAPLIIVLAGAMLGGLWAAGSGTTGISVTAADTSAAGGTVTAWTSGQPGWTPLQGAVGVIDSAGGLVTVKVPATPASNYRITLFLTDPDENVQAYSFFNMGVKVVPAVTSANQLAEGGALFASALSVIDHDSDTT